MTKCLIFPGQGTQKPGMIKELGKRIDEVNDVFEVASNVSCKDIKNLCLTGTMENLKKTENTQIAVTAMNMAYLTLLRNDGLDYQVVAGHSLGQYSALAAAEVITMEQLFYIVNIRAQLMSAVKQNGSLCSIAGLSYECINELCHGIDNTSKRLAVALQNSDIQTVVGGECELVEKLEHKAKEAGAIKTTVLNVSNAFHTGLMEDMAIEFAESVEALDIKLPTKKIMLNCKKDYAATEEEIKSELVNQCYHTVFWADGIKKIISDYNDVCFIEVGVGKTLTGMMRHIDSSKKVYMASKPSDYEKILDLSKEI